jgi:hypothetical protein
MHKVWEGSHMEGGDGRIVLKWEIGYEDVNWIELVHDHVQW